MIESYTYDNIPIKISKKKSLNIIKIYKILMQEHYFIKTHLHLSVNRCLRKIWLC